MRNPDPIILSREAHVDEIMSAPMSQRERLRQLDEAVLDCLYDDHLRAVAHAMYEPEPRPIDWSIARDVIGALALNFSGIAFGGLLIWECLRP